jgi:hypothetical protein
MKFLILVCLAVAAVAEPEAKADPAYLYGGAYGYPYAYSGYTGYASPYAYSGYTGYTGYASPFYGRIFKREAEAEAEAKPEADPYVLYNGAYGYNYSPLGYSSAAYSYPHAYSGYTGYTGYTGYSSPFYGRIFKREAEAEAEAKPEADPFLLYNGAYGYNYGVAPYVSAPAVSTYAVSAPAAVSTYSAYNTLPYAYSAFAPRYYANSAGVEHVVAKREAEAEPQFYGGYYGGYYGRPYAAGYSYSRHYNPYSYASVYPRYYY